ncbi:MAG: D-alanyl-D-alanine carboxypeptidase [Desulfobacterales bacterium]|jgi:D-alanyl-D-alanine carboxypeptidase/D-alanyl-D-alanine-endopeptidase (penicillin-binding protein 4)
MIDTAAHQIKTAINLFQQAFWAGAANRVMAFIDRLYSTACNRSTRLQPAHRSQKTAASALLWLLMICLLLLPAGLKAQDFSELDTLIGKNDSILITDAKEQILYSKNADQKQIPASILKIFTSLMALHYLGGDYRFPTEFYLDQQMNLKIKGYGDPLLISEVILKISQIIAVLLKKSNPLKNLILDDSYFGQPLTIPGITASAQPYDAPNGALCVNFNTVAFKRTAQGYVSAEPQTPLLPFVIKKIKASKLKSGRIVFSHHKDEISIYAGRLFQYFLKKQGIRFNGKVRLGRVNPDADRLIYRYEALTTLNQNVVRLLEHSNNFMTNQLLIATGAHVIGSPGTLAKGVTIANDYARQMLGITDMTIVEGSGISRENRVSATQMDRILQEFLPYHYYMRRAGREYYKTGTLYGISTRAGYIRRTNGQLYRYVIMLNTPGKSTEPLALRLLRILD